MSDNDKDAPYVATETDLPKELRPAQATDIVITTPLDSLNETVCTPQWPEAGKEAVVLDLDDMEFATLYYHNLLDGGVVSEVLKSPTVALTNTQQIHVFWFETRSRKDRPRFRRFQWVESDRPNEAWLVIARGVHPIIRGESTSYAVMRSARRKRKVMQIASFNSWLIRQRLELLLDFREAAIAAGWRPEYLGFLETPPWPAPPELAIWYPFNCRPLR